MRRHGMSAWGVLAVVSLAVCGAGHRLAWGGGADQGLTPVSTSPENWSAFYRAKPDYKRADSLRPTPLPGGQGFTLTAPVQGGGSGTVWVHKELLRGDFVASATVHYRPAGKAGSLVAVFDLGPNRQARVPLPENQLLTVVLQRKDGRFSATLDGKDTPVSFHEAGNNIEGQLVFYLLPGDSVQVKDVKLWVMGATPKPEAKVEPKPEPAAVREPTPVPKEAEPATKPEPVRLRNGAVIPIVGEINADTVNLVKLGLATARMQKADTVLLLLDTDGGVVPDAIEIVSLMDKYEDVEFVAYVHGQQEGGAWSAGAMIAFSCSRIVIRDGTGIGAAQVVQKRREDGELIPVAEKPAGAKVESAYVASWRAKAEKQGHSGAVIEAMMKQDCELWAVKKPGGLDFVICRDKALRPREGELLKKDGEILSLTARQVGELGIGKVVKTPEEAGMVLGLKNVDLLKDRTYETVKNQQARLVAARAKAEDRGVQAFKQLEAYVMEFQAGLPPKNPMRLREYQNALGQAAKRVQAALALCDELEKGADTYSKAGIPVEYVPEYRAFILVYLNELRQEAASTQGAIDTYELLDNLYKQHERRMRELESREH